jgi:hypothetical protein
MRFDNRTNSLWIRDAANFASTLLTRGSKLEQEIFSKDDWKFDNIQNGSEVSYKLIDVKRPIIPILTFKSINPWTSSLGYFQDGVININIRKFSNMSDKEIIGLLLHEYAHYCGFTHGNNFKTEEKCKFSVPYFLSENVSKWI